ISAEYDEPLRIELLQLATLLLKYLQNDLVQHRKELIKFGWNHLKREDNSSKQWAFVNMKAEGEKREGVGDREEDKAAVEPAIRARRTPWLRGGAEVVVVANVNMVGKRWRMGGIGREGVRERMEEKIKRG
ncbi:hypothetical protein BHE74_00011125, partial [Ensete ventricosum]